MLVNYKKLNLLAVGLITFKPGIADYPTLDVQGIEKLKKDYPKVAHLFEEGDLEIVGGGSEQSFFEDENGESKPNSNLSISGLKDKEAIAMVKQTGDRDLLNRWNSETRSNNVQKAISEQLRAIDKAGEKE